MNEIEGALMKIREKGTESEWERCRRLMEEYLKLRNGTALQNSETPGSNGLLVVEGSGRRLLPTEPGLWSFNQCGIKLDIDVQLTHAHKTFFLCLTDGDQLKLNVIRAYCSLLFTTLR